MGPGRGEEQLGTSGDDKLASKLNGYTGAVLALLSAAVIAGGVLVRVEMVAADQEETEKKINCLKTNQRLLDENQRQLQADMAWSHEKLDIILNAIGHSEQVKRPDVEPSRMKEPEDR